MQDHSKQVLVNQILILKMIGMKDKLHQFQLIVYNVIRESNQFKLFNRLDPEILMDIIS